MKGLVKKIASGAVIAFAGLCMVSTASAADQEVVIGGASAQGKFMNVAAEGFLTSLGCSSIATDGVDVKNAVARGLNCTGAPTPGDNVYVYYIQENSGYGCANAPGAQPIPVTDPTSCTTWGDGNFDCGSTKTLPMHIGCADVRCETITQETDGWEDGRNADAGDNENYIENFTAGNPISNFLHYGDPAGIGWDQVTYPNMVVDPTVVVPFGFYVNNKVTKTRCTAPVYEDANVNQMTSGYASYGCDGPECENVVMPADTTPQTNHVAYPAWGYQCVRGAQRCNPDTETCEISGGACKHDTRYVNDANGEVVLMADACPPATTIAEQSADCVSYFKCVDDVCAGGANSGNVCGAPEDCPSHAVGNLAGTECTEMPIDNLSRLMVLHIFSGQVGNWQDFGPWYPDLPIVPCMRHGGSGTHATLEVAVFRGDASLTTQSAPNADFAWYSTLAPEASDPFGSAATVWHYKSSTDLLTDCLDFYWGGVGYIDCDKSLKDGTNENVHIVKYQGVECNREKVKFGEYNYWSAQQCFWDDDAISGDTQTLVGQLLAFTANPTSLSNASLGQTANYWATQGEMTVSKTNDLAYPTKIAEGDCAAPCVK